MLIRLKCEGDYDYDRRLRSVTRHRSPVSLADAPIHRFTDAFLRHPWLNNPVMVERAMILAAGYSTRLRPLSGQIPKPCLPVLGRPLLHHVMDWLGRFGVQEAGVNLCHRPEAVRQAVARYDGPHIPVHFSDESGQILLTAGALAPLRYLFRDGGTFLLVNGKVVTDIDLEPALEYHRSRGNLATLLLAPNRERDEFTHVTVDADGTITGYVPFRQAGEIEELRVFTGIHILQPEILDLIPDGQPFDTVQHLYPLVRERGGAVRAFLCEGSWREFSTPQRYLRHSLELLRAQGLSNWSSPRLELDPTARLNEAIFEPQVEVGAGASVTRSILLGDNRVGDGASLSECIVGPGVVVPPGMSLHRTMVVAAAAVGAEDLAGAHVADGLALTPI
jgi:NDP-sugar pyrophosphorylase family protein